MSELYQHILAIFFGFCAIMNPLANTAVFVGLTGDLDRLEKSRVARKSLLVTFFIIVIFAALGKALFIFFGISLPAFRITGGILVFLIGYQMLQGKGSAMHKGAGDGADEVAISPLAVPILAGPGTIATTISYSAKGGWLEVIVVIGVFAILCGITYFCFIFGERILERVGKDGLSIVTRLMGLILAVIGTQMFLEGIRGAMIMGQLSLE